VYRYPRYTVRTLYGKREVTGREERADKTATRGSRVGGEGRRAAEKRQWPPAATRTPGLAVTVEDGRRTTPKGVKGGATSGSMPRSGATQLHMLCSLLCTKAAGGAGSRSAATQRRR